MNETVNSIEDIDAMLDKEFNIGEDVEEVQDEEVVEDEEIEETTNDDSSNDEQNETEETTDDEVVEVDKEEKPETKQQHAFAKLRSENSQLKTDLENSKKDNEFLKELATQFGYEDTNKFMEEYRDARLKQEAKEKGYDPVLYSQLQDANKRIAQLEKENREAKLTESAKSFRSAMDNIVNEYSLGEDGRNEIFNRLEEAGYDIDTLLNLPSPELIIKGVISDKIAEVSKQKQIDKLQRLDDLSDVSHKKQSKSDELSLDDIVAEEMKEYAKDNFY